MQALACGVSVPNFMAYEQVPSSTDKSRLIDVDEDGSTSAGSSDVECDSTNSATSPRHYGTAISAVYLMGAMSCATPSFPEPVAGNNTVSWLKRTHKQQPSEYVAPPPGLTLAAPPGLSAPFSFQPPPGLAAPPPGLSAPNITPPPGLGEDPKEREGPFDPKAFRRELVSVLKELAQSKNVAAAVRRVRAQKVPQELQAAETMDILTRAAEEPRGNPRRLYFAFVAGLARGSPSAFESAEVLSGIKSFFRDTYEDLCEEVPRLPNMIEAELMPTLREVFSVETVEAVLPSVFKVA